MKVKKQKHEHTEAKKARKSIHFYFSGCLSVWLVCVF